VTGEKAIELDARKSRRYTNPIDRPLAPSRRNRVMRKALWIILTVLLGTGARIARADDVTLAVSGSLAAVNSPGSCSATGCMLGGDIVINNTTGAVISQDVTMSGESPSVGPFSTFGSLIPIVGETRLALVDGSGNFIDLFSATAGLSWAHSESSACSWTVSR
jgi:hypothetical protein